MKRYLGLDVGGTKTHCLVADGTGAIVGFGHAGCGSYEYHGIEAAARENERAVQTALDEAGLALGDIHAIGMGVAGADLPEDYDMLEREIYTPLFGDIPRTFRNDSMAGLRGGTRTRYGVVVACGTGCTCAGMNPGGKETRVGGLGPEFGDACTGTSIGEEGIRTVWRARDGIVPPTSMTERFVARAGCRDIEELFRKLYHREITYADLQPMAQLVFEAAFDGDSAACDILEAGGQYLGAMAVAVAKRLNMTNQAFPVVMAGSVFKGRSPVLIDAMTAVIQRVCSLAEPVMPEFEPVVGALVMAYEVDAPVSDGLYTVLDANLSATEKRYNVRLKAG